MLSHGKRTHNLLLLCGEDEGGRKEMEQKETTGMVTVGSAAPNFRLASAQGQEVALEDYKGRQSIVLWFSKGLF